MQKVFNVAVDIGRKLPALAFEVNTNDLKSVKLIITITNGQTLLNLTDTTVRIAIRKPDNHIIFQDCTVKDAESGQVEIILENQAYITPGTHTAEIMCYKGSEVVAVSGTFSYKSTKGIMNDEAIESKSEFTAINQKIEEARILLEEAIENGGGGGAGVDEQARQDIQKVTQALGDTAKKSDLEVINKKAIERPGVVTIPDGFRWKTFNVLVRKNVFGNFANVKRIEDLMPVKQGKTYYVNINTGVDTNDGLSAATPFKSFSKAIQTADAGEILVAPGLYDRNRGWIKFNPPMSSLIVRPMYPGEIIMGTHQDNLTWTAEGTANVYKAARSLTYEVLDSKFADKYGDYLTLTKRTSIAEVSATPNSWFTDGTSVFVRLQDDRIPDNTVKVYVGGGNGYVGGNKKVYVEGIKFYGGDNPFEGLATATTDNQELYFKDCEFKYGRKQDDSSNGLTIKGTKFAYLENCIASKNQRDGFNYHIYNTVIPNVIEVDCVAYENGVTSSENNNNGSTMHDGGNIIRINGSYFSNRGPNLADVGGSHSWNVGCAAFSSLANQSNNINFQTQEGKMWLDTCVSYDAVTDVSAVGTGATTYARRTQVGNGILETPSY